MKDKRVVKPQFTQQEKLVEIGSYLHQIRTNKGISLEEIAKQTQIQTRLLNAIEVGNLKILPEAVYIRGLIQKFAHALEENGSKLAQDFPADQKIRIETRRLGWIHLPQPQLRPIHLYLAYIALVIGAVNSLSLIVNSSDPQVNADSSGSVAIISSVDSDEATASPISKVVQQGQSNEPVVIEVTLQDQSWLRVVVDGEVQFEGVLPEGTQRTWIANRELTLRTANAGGVVVALNNKKEELLGTPGEVQEVTYVVNPSRS